MERIRLTVRNRYFSVYSPLKDMVEVMGYLTEDGITGIAQRNNAGLLLHATANFGWLDDKMVFKMMSPTLNRGLRKRLYLRSKTKGKLTLRPEGEVLERAVRQASQVALRGCDPDQLTDTDQLIYFLVNPDACAQYDLYDYFLQRQKRGENWPLYWFVLLMDLSYMTLLLASPDPVVVAIADFRTERNQ